MSKEASISAHSSRRQDTAQGKPLTTLRSSSERDLPNVKMGMEFARRSRSRESLRVRVWVWERESDFAMTGMIFVRVERWRMMVMSTGFNPIKS